MTAYSTYPISILLQQLVDDTINTLPEDIKEISLLSKNEGLTYCQIPERKNISVKTGEKKISLALKHLHFGIDDTLIILMVIKRLM